jgi:hypothetical protein
VKPINMTREWQIQARGWAAVAEERRDKIERALQVLREAVRHPGNADGWSEGWEMVSEAVQILESET